ncbi:MAG: hypothetical protein ACYTXT_33395 [Nostoc sp.]|uniref:hypothetical protein n=1 Tax=Nostoc sp. XA010 TaxID=2780407 RepID=UPI001E5C9331|nr:hypothetical protein [Nostoc sp. XA010]MCC5659152.1 hypothetical protein [Nostoc sp. XA010]
MCAHTLAQKLSFGVIAISGRSDRLLCPVAIALIYAWLFYINWANNFPYGHFEA